MHYEPNQPEKEPESMRLMRRQTAALEQIGRSLSFLADYAESNINGLEPRRRKRTRRPQPGAHLRLPHFREAVKDPRYPNAGAIWTPEEDAKLMRSEITDDLAKELGRTTMSLYARKQRLYQQKR